VISKLVSMDSYFVDLIIDCLDVVKGRVEGQRARDALRFVCLLNASNQNVSKIARRSFNRNCKRGILIQRNDGSIEVWTLSKVSFEENMLLALASVCEVVGTETSLEIATRLNQDGSTAQSVVKALKSIKMGICRDNETRGVKFEVTVKESAVVSRQNLAKTYFSDSTAGSVESNLILKIGLFPSTGESVSHKSLSIELGETHVRAAKLFFKTLPDETMRGSTSAKANLEYILKLCHIFDKILTRDDLNIKQEDADEEESAEDTHCDSDDDDDDDARDFSNPEVRRDVYKEEIDGETDRVVFEIGPVKKKKGASLRIQNALGALDQFAKVIGSKSQMGRVAAHVNTDYCTFFVRKFKTEVKSFISQLNSPRRYAPHFILRKVWG
jgi:hypothetical protein